MSATREAIAEAVGAHLDAGGAVSGHVLLLDTSAFRSLYGEAVPKDSATANLRASGLEVWMTRYYETCARVVPKAKVQQTNNGLVIVEEA